MPALLCVALTWAIMKSGSVKSAALRVGAERSIDGALRARTRAAGAECTAAPRGPKETGYRPGRGISALSCVNPPLRGQTTSIDDRRRPSTDDDRGTL